MSANNTITTHQTAQQGGTVNTHRHGAVWVLELDYPERRNALSLPLRGRLESALLDAMGSDDCRVIVLTGRGDHFCSGGDISSFEGVTPPKGRVRMQNVHRLVRLITKGEKPVIAAVEGHAAGAGMCVAADCDIVVASETAKFSCTFNRIGLLPDLGGLWSIPLRMGLGRAKLMMLTGRMLDAHAAQAQGLVEEVCPAGKARDTAIALGHEIAQHAPLSNGMIKAALARGPMPFEESLALETDSQCVLFGSEDFQEGRRAFLEKRKPVFKGY